MSKAITTIRLVDYGSVEHAGRAAPHYDALLLLAFERTSIAARTDYCLLVVLF